MNGFGWNHISNYTDNIIAWNYYLAFLVNFQQSNCPCLATKSVFIQYHENKFIDLDKTSFIEVFHFADEIVFSGLFNK